MNSVKVYLHFEKTLVNREISMDLESKDTKTIIPLSYFVTILGHLLDSESIPSILEGPFNFLASSNNLLKSQTSKFRASILSLICCINHHSVLFACLLDCSTFDVELLRELVRHSRSRIGSPMLHVTDELFLKFFYLQIHVLLSRNIYP